MCVCMSVCLCSVCVCAAYLGAASHAQADQCSAVEGEGLDGVVGQTHAVRDVQVAQVSQTLQQLLRTQGDSIKCISHTIPILTEQEKEWCVPIL